MDTRLLDLKPLWFNFLSIKKDKNNTTPYKYLQSLITLDLRNTLMNVLSMYITKFIILYSMLV